MATINTDDPLLWAGAAAADQEQQTTEQPMPAAPWYGNPYAGRMYGMPMSGSPFYGMMPNSDLQQGQRMSQLQQQQNQAAQQRVQASQQNTRTETQQEEQGQAQARGGAAGYRPGGNVQLRMPSAGRRPNLNPTGSINELQVRNAMEHFERGGALSRQKPAVSGREGFGQRRPPQHRNHRRRH